MTHGEAAHERGTPKHVHRLSAQPGAWCTQASGSVVSHEFGPRENLPPYVCIPNQSVPDAGSGYLSSSYGPFSLGADPANQNFSVRDLNLPGGVDEDRDLPHAATCWKLSITISARWKSPTSSTAMDTFYDRAYSLISSQKAREAFNIKAEPDAAAERIRPQRRGPTDAAGPPTGRKRRPVCHPHLRQGGITMPR